MKAMFKAIIGHDYLFGETFAINAWSSTITDQILVFKKMPCLVTQSFQILLKNDLMKNKNSITDSTKDDCCHILRLQVSRSNHLYCFYMNEASPTPFGITTEKELILFGSRRLRLPRQNNAEFDGEEDYCCKDQKNDSVITTWAVDHRCKSDFTVITQITSAAVYSAVHCISRIPCGLEVFAQQLLKLFAARVEGTVFNLGSFVVVISSQWETGVKVFSKLAVRWTVRDGNHFSLTACVAAAFWITLDARDRLTYMKSNHKNV